MRSDVVIDLTRRCNLDCPHCLRGPAQIVDLDLDIFNSVQSLPDVSALLLTGGEIALRPDFGRLKPIKPYSFVTNGLRCGLPYTHLAIGAERVAVSIDRFVDARRKDALSALHYFISIVPMKRLGVKILAMNDIAGYIEPLVKYLTGLGLSNISLAAPLPDTADKLSDHTRSICDALSTKVQLSSQYLRLAEYPNCCNTTKPRLNLDPWGRWTFCCNLPDGVGIVGDYKMEYRKAYSQAEKIGVDINRAKRKDYTVHESNCYYCYRFFDVVQ